MQKTIAVYVCPEPSCRNYYGCSSMLNLDEKVTGGRGMNGEFTPSAERKMSTCPDCHTRGRRSIRLRTSVSVEVPAPVAA